ARERQERGGGGGGEVHPVVVQPRDSSLPNGGCPTAVHPPLAGCPTRRAEKSSLQRGPERGIQQHSRESDHRRDRQELRSSTSQRADRGDEQRPRGGPGA